MTVEEIARKLCEHNYVAQCEKLKPDAAGYSFEDYWEKNRGYFTERAKTYLEVKECLDEAK